MCAYIGCMWQEISGMGLQRWPLRGVAGATLYQTDPPHRAQLSPTSKTVAPLGKRVKETVKNGRQAEEEGTKRVRKSRGNSRLRGEGGASW